MHESSTNDLSGGHSRGSFCRFVAILMGGLPMMKPMRANQNAGKPPHQSSVMFGYADLSREAVA
jgi:hypothetical protein